MTFRPWRTPFAASTLAMPALAIVFAPCTVSAQDGAEVAGRRAYAVPAGPLGATLEALYRVSNIVYIADPALTDGRMSAGVRGVFTPDEAMRAALTGTGLVAVPHADGGVSIEREADLAPSPASPGAPISQPGMQLPEVRVSTNPDAREPDQGFVALSVDSVTHTETPLAEIPQSVQVVTAELLQRQQARTLNDVLGQVSGVFLSPDGGTVYVRGFDTPLRINGRQGTSALGTGAALADLPIASVERVAILKGADAISAGAAAPPGGMIDIITKQPQAAPVRQLVVEGGSLGHKLASLDLAGAVGGNDALAYRLVTSLQNDARSRDGTRGPVVSYIAPSLGWERNGTKLVAGLELQSGQRYNSEPPFHSLGPLGPQGPLYRALPVAALDAGERLNRRKIFYQFAQTLADGWSFQSSADFSRLTQDRRLHYCTPLYDAAGSLVCVPSVGFTHETVLNTANTFKKVVQAGQARHTLLAGYSTTVRHSAHRANLADADSILVVPNAARQLPAAPPLQAFADKGSADEHYATTFFQDQVKWGRWSLLANVGRASVRGTTSGLAGIGTVGVQSIRPQSKPTYSLGAAYNLTGAVTVYVNRKKTYETGQYIGGPAVVNGERRDTTFNGPPVDGVSNEFGLKLALLDDRLQLTASVYRSTQTNALQSVGFSGDLPAYAILPTTTSKGFELDISGRVATGWNIMGSLSYNDFRFAAPEKGAAQISQIPHLAVNLFSSYEFQDPDWRGWGFGVGVFQRSGYATPVGYRVPGQTRIDASVFRKSGRWTTTLGFKNVFNRTLNSNFASNALYLEPGRTVTLTSIYDF